MSSFDDKTDKTATKFEFDHTKDEDGLSDIDLSSIAPSKNKRIATRYVRNDIVVALCEIPSFRFDKEIFIEFVTLNDITSRGLSFTSTQYMALSKKIVLNLIFHSGMTFKIKVTIVYRSETTPHQYGIKFNSDNHKLGHHLLETQRKLIFK